jgi:aspartate/methionine/tyrosine aminotransferase
LITWVRPKSGTTALLKYAFDQPSRGLCVELLNETGVLFTPGSAMEMEGYVRIGFANNPEVLKQGLTRVSAFLKR